MFFFVFLRFNLIVLWYDLVSLSHLPSAFPRHPSWTQYSPFPLTAIRYVSQYPEFSSTLPLSFIYSTQLYVLFIPIPQPRLRFIGSFLIDVYFIRFLCFKFRIRYFPNPDSYRVLWAVQCELKSHCDSMPDRSLTDKSALLLCDMLFGVYLEGFACHKVCNIYPTQSFVWCSHLGVVIVLL